MLSIFLVSQNTFVEYVTSTHKHHYPRHHGLEPGQNIGPSAHVAQTEAVHDEDEQGEHAATHGLRW